MDRSGVPRRKPVPASAEPLPDGWAADLTAQFRRTLSTKRMNEMSSRQGPLRQNSRRNRTEPVVRPWRPATTSDAATQSPSPQPPAREAPSVPTPDAAPLPTSPPPEYNSIRNIPTVPTAPNEPRSIRFRSMLHHLSGTPTKWENPGLLDEALRVIPLQQIYDEAQEEADTFLAEAASLGDHIRPAWGYQDCVVRALMKWFKNEFFEWVNNPKCSTCRNPTVAKGMVAPLPDESARGANRVELYQCANQLCQSFERFPRYNDAFVLLQTRRGRVGEWVNCFSMLCRAIDSRVRWVWNSEDHVWTEVYSSHRRRWVHVDCCENAWDQPLLYTEGWKKKLAYCIAFSADGCQDVTRRYVRDPLAHALERNKCTEAQLQHIMAEIRVLRRRDIVNKQDRFRLNAEDMREDAELRKLVIEALARNVARIVPSAAEWVHSTPPALENANANKRPRVDADALKAEERRQEARAARRALQQQQQEQQQQQQPPPAPRDQEQQ